MSEETSSETALRDILGRPNADLVGELLRDMTFVGEGFGCYSTFQVRDDAREWSADERRRFWASDPEWFIADPWDRDELIAEAVGSGSGYSWTLGPFLIECCWWWDGDGVLCFRVVDDRDVEVCVVENGDCKKDYGWRQWRC